MPAYFIITTTMMITATTIITPRIAPTTAKIGGVDAAEQ
jgi:hypothetical protein